jgi:hypothetical protein
MPRTRLQRLPTVSGTELHILAKKDWGSLILIPVWLAFWTFGGITAMKWVIHPGPSTRVHRFDRLAKRKRALGTFFYPRGWSMISGCGSRSALIFHRTPSFSPHRRWVHGYGQLPEPNLIPLAEKLGLSKLNFQVLRRTMATLAQGKGSVKDIQAHLRHSKAEVLHVALLRSQKSLFFSPQLY